MRQAAASLAAVSETPRLDAELLMAHALGLSREALLLGHLDDLVPADFATLLARRLAGEPIAYIVGTRAFWTIELMVAPGVLIPRPDSETLIEAAVDHFRGRAPATILDLGTGSGALLLAALDQWPGASGVGIDRSPDALGIARTNAERLGLADRAKLCAGDWANGIDTQFDLVLCNPPYIENGAVLPHDVSGYEPAAALFAGADGLDAYRTLAPMFARLIAADGIGCVEIGASQADALMALFRAEGLVPSLRRDLAGLDRCITLPG